MNESKAKSETIESSRMVSDRGQTVIPKPIRDYMDIQAGDKIVWTVDEHGAVMVNSIKKKSIMALKEIVKKQYSTDDFDHELALAKEQHYH